MSKLTYAEKLRDPRWQKKRLEILERDGWACQICGDKKTTLHVHHLYYEKNLDPWDYHIFTLMTLCEMCHISERANKEMGIQELDATLARWSLTSESYWDMASIIELIGDGIIAVGGDVCLGRLLNVIHKELLDCPTEESELLAIIDKIYRKGNNLKVDGRSNGGKT